MELLILLQILKKYFFLREITLIGNVKEHQKFDDGHTNLHIFIALHFQVRYWG